MDLEVLVDCLDVRSAKVYVEGDGGGAVLCLVRGAMDTKRGRCYSHKSEQ